MPRSWYVQGIVMAIITGALGVFGFVMSWFTTEVSWKVIGGLLAGMLFYQTASIVRLMLRDRREERAHQARLKDYAAFVASHDERMRQRAQRTERWP